VSFLVGAGRIILVSCSVGTGGALEVSFAVGMLIPSSDPFLVRSIKCPATLLLHFSSSFTLLRGLVVGVSWSYQGMEV